MSVDHAKLQYAVFLDDVCAYKGIGPGNVFHGTGKGTAWQVSAEEHERQLSLIVEFEARRLVDVQAWTDFLWARCSPTPLSYLVRAFERGPSPMVAAAPDSVDPERSSYQKFLPASREQLLALTQHPGRLTASRAGDALEAVANPAPPPSSLPPRYDLGGDTADAEVSYSGTHSYGTQNRRAESATECKGSSVGRPIIAAERLVDVSHILYFLHRQFDQGDGIGRSYGELGAFAPLEGPMHFSVRTPGDFSLTLPPHRDVLHPTERVAPERARILLGSLSNARIVFVMTSPGVRGGSVDQSVAGQMVIQTIAELDEGARWVRQEDGFAAGPGRQYMLADVHTAPKPRGQAYEYDEESAARLWSRLMDAKDDRTASLPPAILIPCSDMSADLLGRHTSQLDGLKSLPRNMQAQHASLLGSPPRLVSMFDQPVVVSGVASGVAAAGQTHSRHSDFQAALVGAVSAAVACAHSVQPLTRRASTASILASLRQADVSLIELGYGIMTTHMVRRPELRLF